MGSEVGRSVVKYITAAPKSNPQSNWQGLSDCPYLPKSEIGQLEAVSWRVNKPPSFDLKKHLGEVRGIERYRSSVIVKRHSTIKKNPSVGKRGKVEELSDKSLKRLAFVAFNTDTDFNSIITLTYPKQFSTDGKTVKADLNRLLEWLRYHFPKDKYLWFLEFQERGAPHFHVLSTVNLSDYGKLSKIRRKGKRAWGTHWETWQRLELFWKKRGGGHTSWEVVREKDGGKRYAAKYATKTHQKRVPEAYQNVGRFWGHSQTVKPAPFEFYLCNEAMLRTALGRGGWEYIPPQDRLMHRELYQAANKLDYNSLAWTDNLKPLSLDEHIWAETGFKAVLRLKPELHVKSPLEYHCEGCKTILKRWYGQCPECHTWHTVTALAFATTTTSPHAP